jgi:formate dehydrogenase alpha subunit
VEAVTITLNGVEVSGYTGTTILELARESGVYIPTLCDDPNLAPTGACRLCLVEDERSGALHAACVTPIAPGMTINTNSPRVVAHRRQILKLMLASHPDACLICDKGNRCQLHKLAAEMGIGFIEFQRIPQTDVIEEVNPFIERDLSKCILCGKCLRADQEMVVEGAIDYIHRGPRARVATLNDTPLEKSECTFCGTCVAICPTGALMDKERAYSGTATTEVTTVCPYCGCGCELNLGIKDGRVVETRPAPAGKVNRGTACVRGSYGLDFIHSPQRLRAPLIKVNGDFEETTWEDALARVADAFGRIKQAHGADALACFGSARGTNEENYLLQRLARSVLGTNNVDNGSRLYSAASRVGLGASIGYAGSTGSLEALERAPVIVVIGADPEISAPAVAYAIKRAARFKGAQLICIDPRRTALAPFARLWLRPGIGTDIALLNGLARVIIDEKKFDIEFVTRMTDNFNPWTQSLEEFTPARVEALTGIPRKDLQLAARLLGGAEEAAIVYGNGITQQAGGTGAVIAIANLAMLTGNIGRHGGIFALPRDANASGASDMGTLPGFLPGYQSVDEARNRQRFEARWGAPLPAAGGLAAPEMLTAAREGKVKGMFIMGENPVASFPQPNQVKEALAALDFLVVADIFPTETARLADCILPAASFAEKDGTFTNFEGRVQRLHKAIEPHAGSLPDGEIILRLAVALGTPLPYASPAAVMEEIEEMVSFYRQPTDSETEALGMEADNAGGHPPGTRRLYKGLFPSGFGRFSPVEFSPPRDGAKADYPFTLLTGSGRFGFGGGARSSRSSRLRRFCPEARLEINPADAEALGIASDDPVKITSAHGELTATAQLGLALPPGHLFMPIAFPESPVYGLFATALDPQTRAPALKSCAVRLERIPAHDRQNRKEKGA